MGLNEDLFGILQLALPILCAVLGFAAWATGRSTDFPWFWRTFMFGSLCAVGVWTSFTLLAPARGEFGHSQGELTIYLAAAVLAVALCGALVDLFVSREPPPPFGG